MRFALVNNVLKEPEPNLVGACPGCGQPVIAKCGEKRLRHWAHRQLTSCDRWSEPETDWHRAWKSKFPKAWQEFFLLDETTGEKHMADVRTNTGVVIEFQHSHISPQERRAREGFYKKMVWVVDGTRLKRDFPRFLKGRGLFRRTNIKGVYLISSPDKCFPSDWIGSSVPVVFDFLGIDPIGKPRDVTDALYWLSPNKTMDHAKVVIIKREQFISAAINGELLGNLEGRADEDEGRQEGANVYQRLRSKSNYILERGRWKKRWRF